VVVSAQHPATAWQRQGLVDEFLAHRHTVLPLLDVQEQLVGHVFERHHHPIGRFLDIGSGDGAMSELVLRVEPGAEAVLVDNSQPMLQRAERRIGSRASRWRAVHGDLREPSWATKLPDASFDAAISGFAIHHLPAERKRELFAELLKLLEPGALFVNMDVVVIDGPLRGLFDEQMVLNAIAVERKRGGPRGDAEIERDLLADDDDDRPDTLEDQLRWLREAGFHQPEVHFKWAEAAIFGAVKRGEEPCSRST
jgi:tRNA (cmo5U34)-methyltransferase